MLCSGGSNEKSTTDIFTRLFNNDSTDGKCIEPGNRGRNFRRGIMSESVCDAAIFTGTCDCLVNQRHTVGFFWVAIQHDHLPNPFQSSDILGGKWTLTTLRGNFSGKVLDGTIFNNNNDTFNVTARLRLQKGGRGDVIVSGVLDHSDFPPSPPTFEGELTQP
jgi:hypothetical protein